MRGNLKVARVAGAGNAIYRDVIVLCSVCRCEMRFYEAWRTGGGWRSKLWRFYCGDHVHLA